MPQYVFLLHDDETGWDDPSEEQMKAAIDEHDAFARAVEADGAKVVGGEALHSSSTATVVRPRKDAEALVTDGPFVELKEALGGYYVIETADLDQALRLAAVGPAAAIEVRPVWDLSGS